MAYFAGIDVSLKDSSICIVDAEGMIVREVKVSSEPEALVAFFATIGFVVNRIGLEAGPNSSPSGVSHWLGGWVNFPANNDALSKR